MPLQGEVVTLRWPERIGTALIPSPSGANLKGAIPLTSMSQAIHFELEMPDDLARLRLPEGVQQRLTGLLDRQDAGTTLTEAERHEAEGLVDVAELLSLLRMRAERVSPRGG
jgi:hypothetical protein